MKFLASSSSENNDRAYFQLMSVGSDAHFTESLSLPKVFRSFSLSFCQIRQDGQVKEYITEEDFNKAASIINSLFDTKKIALSEEPKGKRKNPVCAIIAAKGGKSDIVVWNPLTGEVVISNHAWRRFLERFYKMTRKEAKANKFSEDELVKLQSSFLKAKKTNLSERVAFGRLLNNGVKPATYLYNQKDNLRFIVIDQGETKLLVTAEDPYHRGKKPIEAPSECDLPDYMQRYFEKKKELDS
ncbi:MAG: hypothetical protein G01um10143_324 [Parcubacteria group bacterium Gr01-1014_3]|nr:MAG: hypothetical protein G01um10143_324 [Parcubacteria group bacterium Gr01-1014_3]